MGSVAGYVPKFSEQDQGRANKIIMQASVGERSCATATRWQFQPLSALSMRRDGKAWILRSFSKTRRKQNGAKFHATLTP